jgi:DNA-binding response OmpR family regulator
MSTITKSLVIVDDEKDLVNLCKDALEMNGFDIDAFIDPIEALTYIKENPQKYSLIISD